MCVCRLHVSSQTDADKVKFAIILSQGFAEINCFGGAVCSQSSKFRLFSIETKGLRVRPFWTPHIPG